MKRLILVATLTVGVSFAGLCFGQEATSSASESPSGQEQLKALAYFIGGWELTGEITLAGQPTMKFAYERQFKWDLGNNFIHTTTTHTENGKAVLRHRSMIGWDAKTQRITEWGFCNVDRPTELLAGGATVTWSKEGENWRNETEGISGLFTIIDKNTHSYECTFRGDDGSENTCHYTATRKTAPAAQVKQTALPDEIAKELKFFVGEWTVEGEVLGKTLKGRWFAKWSPEKHCLLIRYPLALDGEEIFGNGVAGWDSAKKEVLIQMFYSNGVTETVRYTVESPGVFKGDFTGSASGEASTAKCEMRTTRPNVWTFQTTGHTVGDRQAGELSVRFVRTEPKP